MKKYQIETSDGYILVNGYSDLSGAMISVYGEEVDIIISKEEAEALIIVLSMVIDSTEGTVNYKLAIDLLKRDGKLKEVYIG